MDREEVLEKLRNIFIKSGEFTHNNFYELFGQSENDNTLDENKIVIINLLQMKEIVNLFKMILNENEECVQKIIEQLENRIKAWKKNDDFNLSKAPSIMAYEEAINIVKGEIYENE